MVDTAILPEEDLLSFKRFFLHYFSVSASLAKRTSAPLWRGERERVKGAWQSSSRITDDGDFASPAAVPTGGGICINNSNVNLNSAINAPAAARW